MDGTTKNSGDVDTNTKSSWRPPLNTVSSANEKMRTVQGVSIPNIQWPLSGAGNSENAEASFGDSTPPFLDSPEGIRGSDLADGPNDDGEAPEDPALGEGSRLNKFVVDKDFERWAYADQDHDRPAKDGPRHEEQPAPENLPDDLNDDERQMFADRPFHADQKPDFRFADPRSIHDQASLQYALFCTREDCRARLGMKTMRIQTTPEKCYAVQWLEIQRRFADVWSLLEDDEAPLLIQLKAWTDHFDNWKK